MKARTWFRVENAAADPAVVDIHIIDIIGDWIDELINEYYGFKATVTAKGFIDTLSKLDAGVKTIRVHINSPGGDVFAALNIANALRDQQTSKGRTVETVVDGLAASAASIIAMAGKTVRMADNALMMVHNPWTVAVGNAADLRQNADQLDVVRNTLVSTYQWHSSMSAEDIIALLDAETWMTAEEALANGFVTDVEQGLAAAASIDPRAITALKIPEQYRARVAAFTNPNPPKDTPAPVTPTAAAPAEILAACQTAGCDLAFANQLLAANVTPEELQARVQGAVQARQAAETRASEIRTICTKAALPQFAEDFIAGGMAIERVRTVVTNMRATLAEAEIDGTLDPAARSARASDGTVLNTQTIYAERNRVRQLKEPNS
jgi:ATP-dependent protease ClpP protease subunit